MGWSIGFDNRWKRDIGYGIPAVCDHPKCNKEIDRGISYVCGGEPYGGETGCGLYFCSKHLQYHKFRGHDAHEYCSRCKNYRPAFEPKPDVKEWIDWKLSDESWAEWRKNHPDEVKQLQKVVV